MTTRKSPFFDDKILLSSDIKLVYLENSDLTPVTSGITYLARINRSFIDRQKKWHEILLLTDAEGNQINSSNKIIVGEEKIVSDRKYRNIFPRKLYHFSDGNSIIARNFVDKNVPDNPLQYTSKSSIGSGIFGLCLKHSEDAEKLLVNDNQNIYQIDLNDGYDIQDKEHGESVTTASLLTNRYLDYIISNNLLNKDADISGYIKNDNIEHLMILWNIAFYRTHNYISYELLESILIDYLTNYFKGSESFIELPINYIMSSMKYIGLIADDLYNNGWDRGCISYDYDQANSLITSKAFYECY